MDGTGAFHLEEGRGPEEGDTFSSVGIGVGMIVVEIWEGLRWKLVEWPEIVFHFFT